MKTLVVEDDAVARLLFERQTRSLGYEVTACEDAETALEAYQHTFYPLIVLDLELPAMDGFEFCRRIRSLPGGDRSMILVITAYDQREALKAALDAGADDYLVKPVSAEQVRMRLMILERQWHNLTERKRAEEALRESEERYRTISEIISDFAYAIRVEPDGTLVPEWVTDAYTRITGFTPEEAIVSSNWEKLIYPDDLPIVRQRLQTHLSGHSDVSEYRIVTKNGEIRWLRDYGYPVWDDTQGRVVRIYAAAQNITERRQAEEIRYLLECVINTIPLGVTISDQKGRILYTNPAEASMHGYTIEELMGQNTNILAPKELWKQMPEEEIKHVENRKRESLNIRKDDSVFPVQLISTTVKVPKGDFLGLVTTCEDITERKRAEEALRESEEKFRQLAENIDLIFTLRTEDKLFYASPAYETITGRCLEDYYANPDIFLEYIHPEDRERITQIHYGEELRKTGVVNAEYRIIRPDGTIRWLRVRAVPVFNKHGEIIRRAGFTEDITERKWVEEELKKHQEHLEELVEDRTAELRKEIIERKRVEDILRENEERFRTISELVSDYAYVSRVEPDGWLVREWVTDAFTRITGYRPEEVDALGGWLHLIHPEDKDIATQHRQTFLAGRESITEYRIITKHGDVVWLRDYSRPVWDDAEGRVMRVFGAAQDITERKQAEEDLRLFKTIVESSQEAIAISDPTGRLVYINPAHEKLFGHSLEEARQFNYRDYYPPESLEVFNRDVVPAIARGESWEGVLEVFDAKGRHFPLWERVGSVLDNEGKILYGFGFMHDDTKRKQAEEELQKAKEAAEAANRAKSEFLANMSHEIRTPMNAILGFSEILKERLRDGTQYREYLDRIIESGHNLLRLINDILDLSKIEVGQMEIRQEAVNLYTVIDEIYHIFSLTAKGKRLQLATYISPNTPNTVLLDGVRLRQILVNLVGNAIKFTEKGTVSLKVCELNELDEFENVSHSKTPKLQNSKTPKTLLFEVSDTGIGISQEDQQLIFNPFQQAEQHPRRFGGTGLGLAIVKRLVTMMNGSISVESRINEGTMFKVLLPAISVAPCKEACVIRTNYDSAQIHFHEATILLVEDNISSREVIRAYLTPYHFCLIEAENGQEAIRTLKYIHPDLILMDIYMPVMNGYEATQIIKADPQLRTIPVVAVTAYAMKGQQEQFQAMFDAYLSKPISKHELITTLTKFLPHAKLLLTKDEERGEILPEVPKGTISEKSEILEALRGYVTQASILPQELFEKVQIELLPRNQEIRELMSVDEITRFAEDVITAGKFFTILPLKQYGEELLHSIKVFDIINMKRWLALFPEIVEIICGREE